MKKIAIGMAVVAGFTLTGFAPQAVYAAPPHQIAIQGSVYANNDPVYGTVPFADVAVTCNGITRTYQTTPLGDYLVHFTADECPEGSTIRVAVVSAAYNVSGTAWVALHGTSVTVNIAASTTFPIPELSTVGGVLAAGAGMGVVIAARRRLARV